VQGNIQVFRFYPFYQLAATITTLTRAFSLSFFLFSFLVAWGASASPLPPLLRAVPLVRGDASVFQQLNDRFLRKVPKGSESCSIMVGELEDLEVGLVGWVRLNDAQEMANLASVPLPTRFLMYILGPKGSELHLREMGRCMATMMVDDVSQHPLFLSK
jgi:hypothetical protein